MFTTATAIIAARGLASWIGHKVIRETCSDKNGRMTPAGRALSLVLTLGLMYSGDISSLLDSAGSEAAASTAA